jgi:hypothetical protein
VQRTMERVAQKVPINGEQGVTFPTFVVETFNSDICKVFCVRSLSI